MEDNEEEAVPDVASVHSFINDIVLSTHEVTEVLKDLNPQKSVGPDQVHNKMLSASSHVIGAPLTYLLNRSLAEGTFPSCWKTAHVTPVHKKGNKETCNNYRPISLLSCVGKVFEKCVQAHVFDYLREQYYPDLSPKIVMDTVSQ